VWGEGLLEEILRIVIIVIIRVLNYYFTAGCDTDRGPVLGNPTPVLLVHESETFRSISLE
jgi:hypothetical protein